MHVTALRFDVLRVRLIPSVVNDDSCGVHSRPYHSCVIACVMQVREEHAMGHDSGGLFTHCSNKNLIYIHTLVTEGNKQLVYRSVFTLYTGKLLREKTFAFFAV